MRQDRTRFFPLSIDFVASFTLFYSPVTDFVQVFGHGGPAAAPVSRNYPEMRERLRLLLNKKKRSNKSANSAAAKPANAAGPKPAQPAALPTAAVAQLPSNIAAPQPAGLKPVKPAVTAIAKPAVAPSIEVKAAVVKPQTVPVKPPIVKHKTPPPIVTPAKLAPLKPELEPEVDILAKERRQKMF